MAINLKRAFRAAHWLVSGTPAQRRRVRQEMARFSASLFGDYPLSDDYKYWREDKAFLADYKRLSPGNPYSEDRKWTLREYVRLSNRLEGDLAEGFAGALGFIFRRYSKVGAIHR